ncbi:two-component system response regulator YesN [Neobacillus niacini]|uniref:response regulator transcription factor n=1 Tax=Neobacillus niacini TaxID=86668 RepID=UPI002788E893|nr:response regulator [Neobacillus niacini]MDQ1004879.1 two-component system response regulator YesN [Neobacillus niacini]
MRGIKTVIVDDEPRIRNGIERLVVSNGEEWEVIGVFSDGQAAYEAIVNQFESIDLLITDVQMPIMDGLTLIKKLNSESHDFFTMFISGYDDFKYLQEAIREGAIDYILKPIDRDKFQLQLDEVKERIRNKQKEEERRKDIEERALQLTYAKQIHHLSELTWNDETDFSLMDWTFQFPKGHYKLVHIDIDQMLSKVKGVSPSGLRDWHFAVEKMMNELLVDGFGNQEVQYWIWKKGNVSFWLLLLHEEPEREGTSFNLLMEEYLLKLKKKIQRDFPFTVSIAFGNEFEDLSLLPAMRDQLLSLMKFRIIEGGNKIFHLSTLNNLSNEKTLMMPSFVYKYTEKTVNAVREKNEREVIQAITGFFHELETLKSPLLIQESIQYLCIRIIKCWMENDGFGEEINLLMKAIQITKKSANLSQLKEGIKEWVTSLVNRLMEMEASHSDPISKAKEWILHNLSESITIKKVADHVYLNPTYFCEYFKTQTGETVLSYVTKTRLKRAMELLEKTDLKIYDVSVSVGYQDTKYFSRLFKQWTSQSPSQYREKYHNLSV